MMEVRHVLEEWQAGYWQNAELTLWDVSHYEHGHQYAAEERDVILKICQGMMLWYVTFMLCKSLPRLMVSQVEGTNCKARLSGC
jgi:hypothetical protein